MKRKTDEKLLKTAKYGARNLLLLAILCTFVSGTYIFSAIVSTELQPFMIILSISLGLIAVGYSLLAIVTNRGNEKGLTVAIVVLALQLAFVMFLRAVLNMDTNQVTPAPNFVNFMLPIIIIAALYSNRQTILELKERNLFKKAFPKNKPSKNLCIIGGIIFIMGFVTLSVGTCVITNMAINEKKARHDKINRFIFIIQNQEKEFLESLKLWAAAPDPNLKKKLDDSLNHLRKNVKILQEDVGSLQYFMMITDTYLKAIEQWEKGIQLLDASDPDYEKANKVLTLGDNLRKTALEEFSMRYEK